MPGRYSFYTFLSQHMNNTVTGDGMKTNIWINVRCHNIFHHFMRDTGEIYMIINTRGSEGWEDEGRPPVLDGPLPPRYQTAVYL